MLYYVVQQSRSSTLCIKNICCASGRNTSNSRSATSTNSTMLRNKLHGFVARIFPHRSKMNTYRGKREENDDDDEEMSSILPLKFYSPILCYNHRRLSAKVSYKPDF